MSEDIPGALRAQMASRPTVSRSTASRSKRLAEQNDHHHVIRIITIIMIIIIRTITIVVIITKVRRRGVSPTGKSQWLLCA